MKVDMPAYVEIFEAALDADYTRLRRLGNKVAKAMAASGDPSGAKSLQAVVRRKGVPLQASGYAEALPRDSASRLPLLEEGAWPTVPVMLDDEAGRTLERFVEDARHVDLLSARGVASRLGLLLHGAPGTGKSLLASHVAAQLQLPLYVVRLDSLISSRLGDTAKNVRHVFDFAPGRKAVLFLDEVDAIAKVRDDQNELGELKRVVNTVLQGLDSLQDDTVVVAASNHAHLLDSAIWRRFPYKIALGPPGPSVRRAMWLHYLHGDDPARGSDAEILAAASNGLSGADIENVAMAARRRAILDGEEPPLAHVLLAASASRPGAPRLVEPRGLTHDERVSLSIMLRDRAGLEASAIARAVGVSRQMVHRYLKGNDDVE